MLPIRDQFLIVPQPGGFDVDLHVGDVPQPSPERVLCQSLHGHYRVLTVESDVTANISEEVGRGGGSCAKSDAIRSHELKDVRFIVLIT